MKIVCAWCGKYMGEKEPLDDPQTTHGICPDCYKEVSDDKGRVR